MDEWAVALILIGISVMVTAGLIGMCRMLGGWTYLYALATGNKEERTQLATHEELGNNGYIVRVYYYYYLSSAFYFMGFAFITLFMYNKYGILREALTHYYDMDSLLDYIANS